MGDAHGPWQPMPPALHVYVNDADLVYNRAIGAGAKSLYAPSEAAYGERGAGVSDPFGNVWYIATRTKPTAEGHRAEESPDESSDTERAPHNSPGTIMPFMYVEDAARAAEYYGRVFGAKEFHRVTEPDGKASHVQIAIGETNLMIRDATTEDLAEYIEKGFARTPGQLGGTPLHLYIYVADADAAFKRALESGSEVVDPIDDKDWGDRCGGVKDPFGHIWYIATPLKDPRSGGD
jgi:PhnB protein